MKQISLLSQETIDKIAAGEVVERPASIVKELVENAVDAGANAVTVEIKDGGTSLIRITDNGSGIPREQVQVAFLRHATSKIRSVEDLLTSGTLGFRGEALSSIAAVCQVEMITKTAGSLTGTRYVIEGGVEKAMEEIGAPEGTTFLVRNLFYNTPARKKFLKSAATEAGYVSDLMERMALSHPEISFKFINNRDTKLHTSGNNNLKDVIYGIYGRDITSNTVRIDVKTDKLTVSGFIGKPVVSRGNRNHENYFVNGRYVKSVIVAKAIEDAYKPFMMSHRYPFTVLMIQLDSELVDVNVHPTKMEVRFSNQSEVYDQIYQTVKDGLMARELIPEFSIDNHEKKEKQSIKPKSTQEIVQKNIQNNIQNNFKAASVNAVQKHAETEFKIDSKAADASKTEMKTNVISKPAKVSYPEPFEKVRTQLIAEANSPYELKYPDRPRRTGIMKPVTGNVNTETVSAKEMEKTVPQELSENNVSIENASIENASINKAVEIQETKAVQMELFEDRLLKEENREKHKLIGQLFDTYWMVEFQDKLYMIDQHAAHEKVLYERFMKNYEQKVQTSQMITPPVIVSLTLQEEELLKRHMNQFYDLGFEIEHFGGREYSLRAVPGNLYGLASKDLFLELLDGLTDLSDRASAQMICEKIASMSCKAAVKGNQKLSATEADALIAELLQLENPYNCPHGRPTIISMTKYELEKKFKRIV